MGSGRANGNLFHSFPPQLTPFSHIPPGSQASRPFVFRIKSVLLQSSLPPRREVATHAVHDQHPDAAHPLRLPGGLCSRRRPEILPPASPVTAVKLWKPAGPILPWPGGALPGTSATGRTEDGIRIDTPDASAAGGHAGRVVAARRAFHRHAVQMGRVRHPAAVRRTPEGGCRQRGAPAAAGDMGTPEKQAAGDAAVSRFAAGVDCSGFVSRCWRLSRPFSTRELPALSISLPSWDELKTGTS